MSILVNKKTRVIVQGITGNEGLFQTQKMLAYGTNIVGGVTPGKGGEWVLNGKIPVFESVHIAKEMTGAEATVVLVPARFAVDALYEAIECEVGVIVCITEGIPAQEMVRMCSIIQNRSLVLLGPNSPGILVPGEANLGVIATESIQPGTVGVVSRSGTLLYEVVHACGAQGIGFSSCVGIGGDPITGLSFVDILAMLEDDPHTEQIVLVGEIGGKEEERAASFIVKGLSKPVIALVAGFSAPPGKRMGHAGAIAEGHEGDARFKSKTLAEAGARLARTPAEVAKLLMG